MPDGPPTPLPHAPADSPDGLLGLGPRLKQLLEESLGDAEPPPAAAPRLARYRVLRLIGEGGMGSVYDAEQDSPRRRVALKVIKPGMDTRQVIRRFEAEREALGLMDHPCIARVYDAGPTDAGRPWFAMELVDGVPITDYCDRHRLTVRQRLELFIPVCRAVQHAHQKGVIHRDLKPSNVLVATVDNKPLPKVIDFGIAKATQPRLTGKTTVTEVPQLLGTPEYMSPEQAAGGDVDTRTDVYSLGAMLSELLTGTTPFADRRLRSLPPDEVRRIVRDAEPPKPSTRLSQTAQVADELDWIVMRCLEKDRNRRYGTASELAEDLERYLRNEPVRAGPPSKVYRLRKLIRRNRVPMGVGVVLALLLLAGVAGSTVGMVRARVAQRQAKQEADQVAALNDFLVDMFRAAYPKDGGGRQVTVAEMLDRAEASLPQKFHNQPEAEIRAQSLLAMTYGLLGRRNAAVKHNQMAYDQARMHYGDDAAETLEQGAKLAHWIIAEPETPAELDNGYNLAVRIRGLAERKLPAGSPITHLAAHQVGYALQQKGDFSGAEGVYRRMVEVQRQHPGATSITGKPLAYYGFGWALWAGKKLDEAEPMLREAWRLETASGQYSPRDRIVKLRVIGFIERDKGDLSAAAETFREALRFEKELGHRFPTVQRVSQDYQDVLIRLNNFDAAVSFARQRLELAAADNPRDDTLVAKRTENLVKVLRCAGRQEEAAQLAEPNRIAPPAPRP
jgi:non-specific serine/threonine protein kinase/serine/threonine-protein kinase